ncbi:endonuclease/exonuclease/phosphatase family protein [Psychroserpens sp.]|uniref:endonuclease/exonuclease/phosphatase family protein n=1 Tax=Psychroserpens sp. TaxID=2020870 RepID=UPI001B2C74D7|nr:endonuclease/exonuclease/phosphatase family protein [Psychroserpens sp.]MBO6605205.1 endonuclease/exonuclease/phosphatase family protein [Psychroserpens sp.]MBO6630161.1 endonuclease/exonuclease/phosphatase family protein [Psychroserpens sp.]MBO6653986.1 endonuclease/exonuclease/phosphatase family protein [Psychroserpens sp.]MBO6682307.1 endonuclease/exonuclease/phosphatase family protein [Psychroserpens sp.]MBO6748579.1 endonuclease/exonuclease/phosphatase family protein [Psychroserpens sp
MTQQKTLLSVYTIAFYNLENLFDIYNDATKFDDDFLPRSEKQWTKKRYDKKVLKLGEVIAKIGCDESKTNPSIIGLAEVENKNVIRDLIESHHLSHCNYDFVHYNSQDERGIDVALLYDKNVFEVKNSKTYAIYLEDEIGDRDYTRDILLVSGKLHSEMIHCIVNHWPSRREGEKESNYKRLKAAHKVIEIIKEVRSTDQDAKILVMGDFNDNPGNDSIKFLAEQGRLYNPMETLLSYSRGTLNHNFQWNLFDQILFTTNFFETEDNTLKFDEANIFDEKFLTQYKGKFKGQPFRTFVGRKYKGGYSDHFPVYLHLKVNENTSS